MSYINLPSFQDFFTSTDEPNFAAKINLRRLLLTPKQANIWIQVDALPPMLMSQRKELLEGAKKLAEDRFGQNPYHWKEAKIDMAFDNNKNRCLWIDKKFTEAGATTIRADPITYREEFYTYEEDENGVLVEICHHSFRLHDSRTLPFKYSKTNGRNGGKDRDAPSSPRLGHPLGFDYYYAGEPFYAQLRVMLEFVRT